MFTDTNPARPGVCATLPQGLEVGDYYVRWTGEWRRVVEIDHHTNVMGCTPVVGIARDGSRTHDLLGGARRSTVTAWITPEHRVGTTLEHHWS